MSTLDNRRPTSSRRSRRGSAVMEAALVFPILVTISFPSIDFGYFFYLKHTCQGAAREGARAGITPGATNADVNNAVLQTMRAAGLAGPPAKYTVVIRNATDTANLDVATTTAGTGVLVKVNVVWGTVGTKMSPVTLISNSKQIVGQTVMRKEG